MTELNGPTEEDRLPLTQPKDGRRRRASLIVALALLVGAAGALLAYWRADIDEVANAPLILVELAALPAAPEVTPSAQPPGPQQKEAAPSPPSPQDAKHETKREPKRDTEPDQKPPVETTETAMIEPAPKVEEPIPAPPVAKAEEPVTPPVGGATPETGRTNATTQNPAEPRATGKRAECVHASRRARCGARAGRNVAQS
jgi:outer membrane biosynthesis protein TonB